MKYYKSKLFFSLKENGYQKIGNPEMWKDDGKSAVIKVEKETANPSNSKPSGQDRCCSIANLTPYMNKWTIKGITIDLLYYCSLLCQLSLAK